METEKKQQQNKKKLLKTTTNKQTQNRQTGSSVKATVLLLDGVSHQMNSIWLSEYGTYALVLDKSCVLSVRLLFYNY